MGWKFPYCPLSSHLLLNKVLLVFPDEIEFLPSSHILERRGFQDLTLANVRGKVRIIRQYKYSASDEVRITASVKGICGCDIDTFSGFSERNSALASLSVRTNTNYEPVVSLTLFVFLVDTEIYHNSSPFPMVGIPLPLLCSIKVRRSSECVYHFLTSALACQDSNFLSLMATELLTSGNKYKLMLTAIRTVCLNDIDCLDI